MAGAAHFMSGSLYYSQAKFAQTDKELREALPNLDNAAMKAEALYYLGFANYKMDKAQDAVAFYRACGAMTSRFKAACNKNVVAIRSEYTGIK
jgi:TolA-binding protein